MAKFGTNYHEEHRNSFDGMEAGIDAGSTRLETRVSSFDTSIDNPKRKLPRKEVMPNAIRKTK